MWKKHAMYWSLHFANVFTTCQISHSIYPSYR